MRASLFILLLACVFVLSPCKAQFHFDHPVRISTADGLPGNYITAFEEDNFGFIWIGTSKGLCRYDGSRVFQATPSEQDSSFLPSENIRSLYASGDSLYIGTSNGLSILNLKSWTFENIDLSTDNPEVSGNPRDRNFVHDIYEDRNGDIWLAPGFEGFVKWSIASNTFCYFPLGKSPAIPKIHGLSHRLSLRRILQDIYQDSIYWGITGADLIRLNTETGRITRIRYSNEDSNLDFHYNRHLCMYQHTDGKIYMGQWHVGMIVYDPSDGSFYIPKAQELSVRDRTTNESHGIEIYPKSNTELYFTYSTGLYIYNTTHQSLSLVQKNQYRDENPKMYGVDFVDSRGITWYGSSRGVYTFDPVENQFAFYSMKDLNPTQISFLPRSYVADFFPGYLTFAGQYSDGLYSVNLSTGHSFKTPAKDHFQELGDFLSWGVVQLSKDELLVSEKRSLYYYRKGAASLIPFEIQPSLRYLFFGNLAIDNHNKVWIGTPQNGLWSIDLSNKEIKDYSSQLPPNHISSNFVDNQGNVWFTSGRGHVVYSRKDGDLTSFDYRIDSLKTQGIGRNFCQCPNGDVWWGGEENGLSLFSPERPKDGMIQRLTLKDNLQEFRVSAVACDQKNMLWVLSPRYILKVDPQGGIIAKYSHSYGLATYTYFLFDMLDDGRLLIGARDGVYIFNPDTYKVNTQAPKPYVFEVSTNKEKKQSLKDHLLSSKIYLSPNENVLTISFSSLNFTMPEKTEFLYQLNGVDEKWQNPGGNRSITYTNLKGGEYRFLLKASNNEGLWSEAYSLNIYVGTPWFKAGWFFIALGITILGLIYLMYRYRVRQIKKEGSLKADFENQIANIEMSALRAQMNPHFIFNCLNSIELYIIKNDTKKATAYLSNFSRLVRLILQNSRSNYVNLKDELEALELYIKLEQMRFRHSFEYLLEVEPGLNPEDYDIPPMLIQPFIENAIWHGLNNKKQRGKVKVSISNGEDVINCIIEDDGVGREESRQINEAKKVKRKSMGVNITKERIDIINKLYNTENKVEIIDLYNSEDTPAGTRVIINIPI